MLTCIVTDGGESNTFQWEKDGMVLDGETSDILILESVNASSGGVYACTVNEIDSANITLFVAPYIVTPLDEQVFTVAGDMVTLTCEADGFPSPAVSWFRVSDTDMTTTPVMSISEFSLDIVVSFSSFGVYRCVAEAEISGMTFNATDETTLFGKNTENYHIIRF